MSLFVDNRHELAIRGFLGFGLMFERAEDPLVTIIGSLGFVLFDGTLYVRILCPGKMGKHPADATRQVRW